MLDFLRWLFSGRVPDGRMAISIRMDKILFARINRVAKHHEVRGDTLVNRAVEDWLAVHEEHLLAAPPVKGDARPG